MPNRSANFVAALFATVLAGANLATATDVRSQAAPAPDNCLTAPKDNARAGSHWHYRLERGTRRQCWYLKDENDKTARAAPQEAQEPQDSSPEAASSAAAVADPVPPQPRPAERKLIANAHAELTPPRVRTEQNSNATIEPQTTGMGTVARIPKNPAAIPPNIASPPSAAATRWLETSGVNWSSGLHIAAAEPPVNPPENDQATPQTAPPAVVPATVDSSMAKQSASMQMLFLVMAGALAMAGITASLVFRFGRRARARRLQVRRDRRAIWDSIHAERSSDTGRSPRTERPSPSMLPSEDVPLWRRAAPQDPRAPDDPERRVTAMLSRLARSAQH